MLTEEVPEHLEHDAIPEADLSSLAWGAVTKYHRQGS